MRTLIKFQNANQMDEHAVALTFAPNLFRGPHDSQLTELETLQIKVELTKLLIQEAFRFFSDVLGEIQTLKKEKRSMDAEVAL